MLSNLTPFTATKIHHLLTHTYIFHIPIFLAKVRELVTLCDIQCTAVTFLSKCVSHWVCHVSCLQNYSKFSVNNHDSTCCSIKCCKYIRKYWCFNNFLQANLYHGQWWKNKISCWIHRLRKINGLNACLCNIYTVHKCNIPPTFDPASRFQNSDFLYHLVPRRSFAFSTIFYFLSFFRFCFEHENFSKHNLVHELSFHTSCSRS